MVQQPGGNAYSAAPGWRKNSASWPGRGARARRRPRLSKEEREQQIVRKAIELFAERGFSGSTHDIARALGITQPLLYNYFPTREALVDRVYDEVFVHGTLSGKTGSRIARSRSRIA